MENDIDAALMMSSHAIRSLIRSVGYFLRVATRDVNLFGLKQG